MNRIDSKLDVIAGRCTAERAVVLVLGLVLALLLGLLISSQHGAGLVRVMT